MKKTLAVLLLIAISLFAASCSSCNDEHEHEDELGTQVYEAGFHYNVPDSFTYEEKLAYGDRVFKDANGAYFFFNAFSGEDIEEDWHLAPDAGVRDVFASVISGLPFSVDYEHRESDDSIHFDYVWTYEDAEGMEPEYYRYMIVRTTDYVYIITLTCPASEEESYKEIFDDIIDSISLDERIH